MKKSILSLSVLAAFSILALPDALATPVPENKTPVMDAAKIDAITGATKKREAKSGAIRLTETLEGQQLLRDMVREFIWTGDTEFNGHQVKGGRQMFSMATSDMNMPESITAELTPDYDENTGLFRFYGTTAKDSGKILRASRSGTGISVSWVKQLREDEMKKHGWNYYDSYGISFSSDLNVFRGSDLTGDPIKDREILDRLSDIMGKSLSTIKEWSLIWKFDPNLKGKALQDAKDFEIRDFLTYEDVYELIPRDIIVISYFARPLMVNPNNAFVYREYAIDSNTKGFKLETSNGYKAAVRDTNCQNVTTTEKEFYTFLDSHYPRTDKRNIIRRLEAYKNKVIFGTETPEPNAKPTKEGVAIVDAQYGGNYLTAAEVDKAVAGATGVKKVYHWIDKTKSPDMPDYYMVTYTGHDSSAKPYRVDLPNWNRWFVLHPNNVCGIATRHTIVN